MKKVSFSKWLLLLALICAMIMPIAACDSGNCGEKEKLVLSGNLRPEYPDVRYNLYSNGVLKIFGTGEMGEFGSAFEEKRDDVISVVVESGVTSISNNAFRECSSLTSVIFGNAERWKAGNSKSIDASGLTDPATAVTYLTKTYLSDYWRRGEN